MEGIRSGSWPRPSRADILRALALAFLSVLIWCTVYDRWTAASWQTPLEYLSVPEKGDVFEALGEIRAAQGGHFAPFVFINVPQLGAPFEGNWNDYPVT